MISGGSSSAETIRAIQAGCCPSCSHRPMLPGPRGGASQNFFCEACGQGWNVMGPNAELGVEALGPTGPETLAMYQRIRDDAVYRETILGLGLDNQEATEVIDFINGKGDRSG